MKILIINPNSSVTMTKAIQKGADDFARNEFTAVCMSTPGAPEFIETYEDQMKAAPGMILLLREHEKEYDAFINACHCDPNLDIMKEICPKPVVGIGEASMRIASMLGHRFSVISASAHSIPNKEALIQKYHLTNSLASIRPVSGDIDDEENVFTAAQAAVTEDMAEVIVLGCAGMTGLDKRLEKRLGVPVLDGVVCALIIATGLAKYGVGISKIRRYGVTR